MALVGQLVELWAGDTAEIDVVLTESDGTPLDFSNRSLRWVLCNAYDRGLVLVEKVTGSGIEVIDPDAGIVRIFLDSADTRELGGEPYFHELPLHDEGFAVAALTLLSGSAIVHTTALR
jgi:hypothetical protein